ncbi:MAG: hypothetical protein ABI083_06655 [Lapillicoccus sp.]
MRSDPPPTVEAGIAAGSLVENGVEVTLRWDSTGTAAPVLIAEFTPTQPGFHLYSVDLPDAGVHGVGRPTRLAVGGALTAVGRPVTDVAVETMQVAGIPEPIPVYPDGPVTVRQAVRVGPSGGVTAFLTYAACSRTTCLPPVSRQRVEVSLPPLT